MNKETERALKALRTELIGIKDALSIEMRLRRERDEREGKKVAASVVNAATPMRAMAQKPMEFVRVEDQSAVAMVELFQRGSTLLLERQNRKHAHELNQLHDEFAEITRKQNEEIRGGYRVAETLKADIERLSQVLKSRDEMVGVLTKKLAEKGKSVSRRSKKDSTQPA